MASEFSFTFEELFPDLQRLYALEAAALSPSYGEGFQGRLHFEDEDSGRRLATGEELAQVLAGNGSSVVLLNACQSGMTHAGLYKLSTSGPFRHAKTGQGPSSLGGHASGRGRASKGS